MEQGVRRADQLYAAGEFRAAARQWRQLADEHARRHGDDDPVVFDLRLRAARAHLSLGEPDRALRQMNLLLERRTRADGPEHPAAVELRQEIARLSSERRTPSPPGSSTPVADR
jgi:eukaryotic-like serine/threonine-protein kinase